MPINAYPLQWPEGWPRKLPQHRTHGHFGKRVRRSGQSWSSLEDITIAEAVQRVLAELERMGIGRDDAVISTNLRVRLDGLPRSDQRRPDDPGAAVYWQEINGARRCIAIDRYLKVEDNLAAIAATLDAMRAIERHGGAEILDRAFTGFTSLPAPGAPREWWEVLGVQRGSTLADARAAFRRLASEHHPDRGGSAARMAEINEAWAKAQQEL